MFHVMSAHTLVEVKEPEVQMDVQPDEHVERQVTVHCSVSCVPGMGVRIWPSTYLVTEDGTKIELVHWLKISMAPEWTRVLGFEDYQFTLIFQGLPNSCKVFSLQEIIPEPGGFYVRDIKRNESDVYHVTL
jgi:hypothetical protein